MSAFIVEEKTINRILFWLRQTEIGPHQNLWYKKTIAEAAQIDLNDPNFMTKLGASMMMLNVDAVNSRYLGANEKPYFAYRVAACNDYQALKSLRCWIYQCAEGDVPERPLFKAFHEASLRLALAIVERTDMYAGMEWG